MNINKMKYMSPKEVATELEVSPATVVRWIHDGVIPAKWFGQRTIKIARTDVEHFAQKGVMEQTK